MSRNETGFRKKNKKATRFDKCLRLGSGSGKKLKRHWGVGFTGSGDWLDNRGREREFKITSGSTLVYHSDFKN